MSDEQYIGPDWTVVDALLVKFLEPTAESGETNASVDRSACTPSPRTSAPWCDIDHCFGLVADDSEHEMSSDAEALGQYRVLKRAVKIYAKRFGK